MKLALKKTYISLFIARVSVAAMMLQVTSANAIQSSESIESIVLNHSSKNKVIMFGGKHEAYRNDNDFVAELLPKLKEQGFEYLAIEFEKNPRKNSFHKIIQNYTYDILSIRDMRYMWIYRERVFCAGTFDLIDTAKALGMRIVFYDADEGAYKFWYQREQIAFNNLRELIFNQDPDARVIVFCGALHINEKPHDDIYGAAPTGSYNKIKYLANYLDQDSRNRNFTVSLIGWQDSEIIAPYCDLVVDLDENAYYYQPKLR
jgi:hypothetical protein